MAKAKAGKVVVTFHTTTQAILMEQCCKRENVPGRLIPVPRQISAGCGMAWCAPAASRKEVEMLIKANGIEMEDMNELLL